MARIKPLVLIKELCVAGQAHTLDGEAASPSLSPGDVTSAAQQEMHLTGGGKPQNAVPAPLYAGGNPPSMMASPAPNNGSSNSPSPYPSDTADYIHVSASYIMPFMCISDGLQ